MPAAASWSSARARSARLAARNLVSRGATTFVANRTLDRASSLAERFGGEALRLDRPGAGAGGGRHRCLLDRSPRETILAREQVEHALSARRGRPLLLVDLAVPRDVDPTVEGSGCFLYDIDDLQSVVEETLDRPAGRRRRAETIVAREGEQFRQWLGSLDSVPAIASLREQAEAIRRELKAARAGPRLAGLSEHERNAVES